MKENMKKREKNNIKRRVCVENIQVKESKGKKYMYVICHVYDRKRKERNIHHN